MKVGFIVVVLITVGALLGFYFKNKIQVFMNYKDEQWIEVYFLKDPYIAIACQIKPLDLGKCRIDKSAAASAAIIE